MPHHETFMRRALELARQGETRVEPNPMVGAVIVRNGRVVAEGWHDVFGGPHAEIQALHAAASRAGRRGGATDLRDATIYVTLEPCAHFGKTSPCAPALVESGIRRVVLAVRDPNPVTGGRGTRELRRAGVEVVTGVLRAEAEALNAPFFKLHRTGLPWVIAKWAMSADGRIATRAGRSQWITGPEARAAARRIRARCQAVVVGIGTALHDDPELLPGLPVPPSPFPRPYARVVLDSLARLPLRSKLVRSASAVPVLVAVSARAPGSRCRALDKAGCEVLVAGRRRPEIGKVLETFGRRGFTHVMVEGGGGVLGSLFDDRLADEVYAFVAPRVIGGQRATGPVGGTGPSTVADGFQLERAEWIPYSPDLLLHGYLPAHR
jgi:diaminohydroxyphosphoribosylaminopyrimidine deaminase/5-amino-6-(5-phosphoribosylamino)uracil reductase